MAIALAASYFVSSPDTSKDQAIGTTSFTPATGEVIVVKAVAENETLILDAPIDFSGVSGITWTQQLVNVTTNYCYATLWTGVVTTGGTSTSISIASNSHNFGWFSMVVERWTGAQLAATPATTKTLKTTGPYSSTIVTTAVNSVVSFLDGDWAANTPGTVTYSAAGTVSEGNHDKSPGAYVAYYAYQNAPTAGTQTFGVTSVAGGDNILMAIEVKETPTVPPAVTNHGLIMMGVGI